MKKMDYYPPHACFLELREQRSCLNIASAGGTNKPGKEIDVDDGYELED